MPFELKVVSRLPESNLVQNDDVVAIIFLSGNVLTAINTRDNKGIIKAWTPDFQLVYEFVAHPWPINHMVAGEPSHFFTSSSDSTISHWVQKTGDEEVKVHCERIAILTPMPEPAWRLRYDETSKYLYSGDATGEVRMWENDELVGCLGTVEEVWDMLVDSGILYTTRNCDVYLTTLRTKGFDEEIRWSIKNIIEGTGPLFIQNGKLCCQARRDYNICIHSLEEIGNSRLAVLAGHKAIVTALSGFMGENENGNTFKCKDVLFSSSYDGVVIAWDLDNHTKIGEVKLHGYINSLAVDPASGICFAGGQDRFICAMKIVKV